MDHLEQVQHCTDFPRQVTFPAHTEQGKMGPGLERTLPLIKRRRIRSWRRARENRRPILRKLCAALLRSFRGQYSEKMKGSARGNWDSREVQQPFWPNPNRVGDRTTTLKRLLNGGGKYAAKWCTYMRTIPHRNSKMCISAIICQKLFSHLIRKLRNVIVGCSGCMTVTAPCMCQHRALWTPDLQKSQYWLFPHYFEYGAHRSPVSKKKVSRLPPLKKFLRTPVAANKSTDINLK